MCWLLKFWSCGSNGSRRWNNERIWKAVKMEELKGAEVLSSSVKKRMKLKCQYKCKCWVKLKYHLICKRQKELKIQFKFKHWKASKFRSPFCVYILLPGGRSLAPPSDDIMQVVKDRKLWFVRYQHVVRHISGQISYIEKKKKKWGIFTLGLFQECYCHRCLERHVIDDDCNLPDFAYKIPSTD